jgi:hypothetical protein
MNRPYALHRFHTSKHGLKVSRSKDGTLVFFFFRMRGLVCGGDASHQIGCFEC